MSKKKEDKLVEIEIKIDVEKKFFKIVDGDYTGCCGAISGGYKDEDHFIRIFSDYLKKYICID